MRVFIAVPPVKAPWEEAAVAGGPAPEGLQKLGDLRPEVVIRKSGIADRAVTLNFGDVLQLDGDETMEATDGGITLIVLEYVV